MNDRNRELKPFVPQPDDDMIVCRCEESTKLVKGIVSRELGVRPNELGPATGRAPMRPIEMKVLAKDKEETK